LAIQSKLISQYIKDLSFENYAAQKNEFEHGKFDLNMDLNIKKKDLKSDLLEITINILLEAKLLKEKKFLIELSYASTFKKNKQESTLDEKKFAFVDCPNIMFPFVRQIVFNISQNSGFLPINLEYINFQDLFDSQMPT
tara:strand:- start:60 stop:476 length:417 start_codon:yes stop_codon:yes gene_type:complete